MSNFVDEYELMQYKELEVIDKKGKIHLVRDVRDNRPTAKTIVFAVVFLIFSDISFLNKACTHFVLNMFFSSYFTILYHILSAITIINYI